VIVYANTAQIGIVRSTKTIFSNTYKSGLARFTTK